MEANVKAYERFLQFMEWLWCTLGYAGLLCVSIVVIEGGIETILIGSIFIRGFYQQLPIF